MHRSQLLDDDIVVVAHGRSAVTDAAAYDKDKGLAGLAPLKGSDMAGQTARGVLRKRGIDPLRVAFWEVGFVNGDADGGQAEETQTRANAGGGWDGAATRHSKVCGTGLACVQAATDHFGRPASQITEARPFTIAIGYEKMWKRGGMFVYPGSRGEPKAADITTFAGLTDPFTGGSMGRYAVAIARHYGLSAADNATYSAESREGALRGVESIFPGQIVPVQWRGFRAEPVVVTTDDGPKKVKTNAAGTVDPPAFKPVFDPNGPISAYSSSTTNDGAAAMVFTQWKHARNEGLDPLAKFIAVRHVSGRPHYFPAMPIEGNVDMLEYGGISAKQVLFLPNEAFSCVPLGLIKALGLDRKQVNPYGGALVIGHPLGMSALRVAEEGIDGMSALGFEYAQPSACIGSGQAITGLFQNIQ